MRFCPLQMDLFFIFIYVLTSCVQLIFTSITQHTCTAGTGPPTHKHSSGLFFSTPRKNLLLVCPSPSTNFMRSARGVLPLYRILDPPLLYSGALVSIVNWMSGYRIENKYIIIIYYKIDKYISFIFHTPIPVLKLFNINNLFSIISLLCLFDQCFQYYIHSYLDVAHITSKFPHEVSRSEEMEIDYKMIETSASPVIRYLTPSQRKCRFDDEPLTNDVPVYSTSICYIICRYKMALKLCGCKPFFYHFLGKWLLSILSIRTECRAIISFFLHCKKYKYPF